ncbi:aminoglycoside phosphotransferase family protein [Streptomyces sp. SBT349]|uniref:aminoglycoside phosphotransferase family protein n=1 Tax=Streptomyces sp. SBT349 TaxID=1580539 RepID=UPI00066CD988|nr:aminoglycoside phosphotransferase family protein [Streptomyces sp. SBT349]
MHADQLDVDVPLVRRLIAGRFPRWAGLPVRAVVSSGTVNAMFRLGATMSVRLPLTPGAAGDVARERLLLPRLAPLLPVPVPTVLGEGAPTGEYPLPWTVHRWLPGRNPDPAALAGPGALGGARALAADLAALVGAVRAIEPADGPPAHRGGPLTEQDAETRSALRVLEALGGMADTEAASAAWEEALGAPAWDGPPVWLHADLMPGNLLVAPGEGGQRLAAVIDFGTAGVGDPACDLIVAWNLLPAGARAAFRDALGVDDATWARGRGLALSMALIQLPYYHGTNPGIAANARHVIREVLADRRREEGAGANVR